VVVCREVSQMPSRGFDFRPADPGSRRVSRVDDRIVRLIDERRTF
jgi:hypothetical protein